MRILKNYSRNFLIAASVYRKMVKNEELDFSLKSLKDQYDFETFGKADIDLYSNGYNRGKWILDVTLKQMHEDFINGIFTKRELKEK